MTYQPLHYDPDSERDRRLRHQEQLRRLGSRDPACSVPGCLERDPFALTVSGSRVVCYEHQTRRQDRSWVEEHHVSGRANDPDTIALIPGNDHRVLSDLQRDWPVETLRNPQASPLVRAAAAIRGWLDVLWLILTRTVAWIPPALESLNQLLVDVIGPTWWQSIRWEPTS